MKFYKKVNLLLFFINLFNIFIKIKSEKDLINNSLNNKQSNHKLKILVTSASIGWSHLQFQGRLADILVDAGHEVVKYNIK